MVPLLQARRRELRPALGETLPSQRARIYIVLRAPSRPSPRDHSSTERRLGVFMPYWASLRSVISWRVRKCAGHAEGSGGGRFRRPAYWMRLAWISPLSMAACSSVSLVPVRSAKKYGPEATAWQSNRASSSSRMSCPACNPSACTQDRRQASQGWPDSRHSVCRWCSQPGSSSGPGSRAKHQRAVASSNRSRAHSTITARPPGASACAARSSTAATCTPRWRPAGRALRTARTRPGGRRVPAGPRGRHRSPGNPPPASSWAAQKLPGHIAYGAPRPGPARLRLPGQGAARHLLASSSRRAGPDAE